MHLAILQAVQQAPSLAKQVAPNLYVTVQQPVAGLPEWEKILITAGTGAVFGIAGALATELVKTSLVKKKLRMTIAKQLTAEMSENLEHVETCTEVLMSAVHNDRLDFDVTLSKVRTNARYIDDDRYKHYFASEKLLVYEIDPNKLLAEFYNHIKHGMQGIDDVEGEFATASFKVAVLLGFKFLRSHGIHRTRRPHLYKELHHEAVTSIKRSSS